MIVIVDYGAGNLRSVRRAVEHVGGLATVTSAAEDVSRADAIIMPGVGAASDTMANLVTRGLVEPLRSALRSGTPFLGVCMGLQALMTGSEEGGWQPCLDIIPGTVRRLPAGQPVPHMGWNQIKLLNRHEIFRSIPDESDFYFVHSYYCDVTIPSDVIGITSYGVAIPAVVARDNLVATQFHPEKSGELGLQLYANFLRWAADRTRARLADQTAKPALSG